MQKAQAVSHLHEVICAFLGVVLGKQFPLGRRSPRMNSSSLEPHLFIQKM